MRKSYTFHNLEIYLEKIELKKRIVVYISEFILEH